MVGNVKTTRKMCFQSILRIQSAKLKHLNKKLTILTRTQKKLNASLGIMKLSKTNIIFLKLIISFKIHQK